MFRIFTSRGSMRYSMSTSLNTLTISSIRRALLLHLSPISWKFIWCVAHTVIISLFISITSLIITIGAGCQCSFLLSIYLQFSAPTMPIQQHTWKMFPFLVKQTIQQNNISMAVYAISRFGERNLLEFTKFSSKRKKQNLCGSAILIARAK